MSNRAATIAEELTTTGLDQLLYYATFGNTPPHHLSYVIKRPTVLCKVCEILGEKVSRTPFDDRRAEYLVVLYIVVQAVCIHHDTLERMTKAQKLCTKLDKSMCYYATQKTNMQAMNVVRRQNWTNNFSDTITQDVHCWVISHARFGVSPAKL